MTRARWFIAGSWLLLFWLIGSLALALLAGVCATAHTAGAMSSTTPAAVRERLKSIIDARSGSRVFDARCENDRQLYAHDARTAMHRRAHSDRRL